MVVASSSCSVASFVDFVDLAGVDLVFATCLSPLLASSLCGVLG